MFAFGCVRVSACFILLDAPPVRTDGAAAVLHASLAGEAASDAGADVDGFDPGALKHSELVNELVDLVAERARLEGRNVAVLGELVFRDGAQSAAWQLREYTRMNSAQARSEARLAEALVEHDFADTLEALSAGEIQMSHAKVIARESPKKHRRSEDDFLELCRSYPSDVVARHSLAYESLQVYADREAEAAANVRTPVDAELALQRQERRCSMLLGDDGMWHLRADLDFITGREISQQIAAAERAVRQRDDADELTYPQLNADALCELILGRQKPQASLVIVADYDTVSGRLDNPRFDDGTSLSANQLAELAANAKVLPAMFKGDWSELALGRARSASDAQRIVLAIRDGGCIGCATPSERCHAHHIEHYEDNGLTVIPNLAMLCEPCHLDHHQHHWAIDTPSDGTPRRAPPSE